MAKVVNLNRFRKKRAKEQKEARAERNRRYHGRTRAERMSEELEQRKLQQKLEGAYLAPERVDVGRLAEQHPGEALELLERMSRGVVTLAEYSKQLRGQQDHPGQPDTSEEPSTDDHKA